MLSKGHQRTKVDPIRRETRRRTRTRFAAETVEHFMRRAFGLELHTLAAHPLHSPTPHCHRDQRENRFTDGRVRVQSFPIETISLLRPKSGSKRPGAHRCCSTCVFTSHTNADEIGE